ncbi:MAG: PKD domain-containing protein, partial [Candidatus Marinimicrobia bacterium]|nr:PKD domain-containing protein [Candidatus Neomarinimicrobiota bacterium]
GFVNGTSSPVTVSAVTLTYADGAFESRALDISAKNLTVVPNGAFGVAVSIPLSEIIAGDNGYSRDGTVNFGSIGSIPFEVRVKRYPSVSVSPEFTELPPVAWGETVSSEFTISNSGDIDLEFILIPEIYFWNRELDFFLLSVNEAPVNMTQESKLPRDFEKVVELDYQNLSEALKNSERPVITIDAAESASDPFMVYWSDSLNDAAEVAKDWEILDYSSGDNWELYDIDTSQAVDNVFLAGDFIGGYQNNTLSVAASPYFNFRSIIESTEKIPVYLQFDYATELEVDHDYFYINMISNQGNIGIIASTSRDLTPSTDSAQTVMVDISPWLEDLVMADSVTFWFIADMDESNSAGFGVLFDNVSLWLGESPLVYRDVSGNGVLDDIVQPDQDFPVSVTLNTGFFPEGEIVVASWIRSNDPRNERSLSVLIANTEYGHITVAPEYSFVDSLYRGETMKSTFSITNDGLVDIKYLTLLSIQYQPPEPVLRINIDNVSTSTQQKSETGVDHEMRSERFHSRLSNIKNRPVLQSINQKAASSIYKVDETELASGPWSWMETFDESTEIPAEWTSMDYTYGFGGSWAIDSIDIDSVTKTNVALFGDLTTLEYYNRSDCELISPWILIPESDTMRTILEFDYSTMLELYYDWFDVYVVWREPGDETGESWNGGPVATNDPGWWVPLLVSDPELHTFSTRLPLRVKGKEVMLMFYIYTDESVNTGYTLIDNVMLYQKPRNFYMTNRFGELPVDETVNIDIAVKNTTKLIPGDYSIYSIILYGYKYDSLYNDIFDESGDIFLGQNLTEFTILNHEPVVQPDTLFAISGEVIGLKKILASITRNDYDLDDSIHVVDMGEPVYGEFKNLLGIGSIRDNMLGYAYVAPLLPETRERLEDKFIYWSSDGWSIVGAPVTVNVLQTPQFIRSAQHVFPINEDDSLTIDMMRLAAGLSIPGIRLSWNTEPTVNFKGYEESSLITITPIPDFFGTTSAMLHLKRNTRTIDSTLVQFVVNSVNDMPVAAMTMSVSTNRVSFTDESHDSRDKDGGIVAWNWDFGDDLTSEEQNPVHAYADSGTYHITLTVTDNAGAQASVEATVQIASFVGLADVALAIPEEFRMHQNFPNPYNPTTTIHYDIPKESHIRIEL